MSSSLTPHKSGVEVIRHPSHALDVSGTNNEAPADSGPNTSGATLVSQAAQGSLEIVRVVAERTAECPNVKFVIFGTSSRPALNNSALNNSYPCLVQ